MLRFKNGKIVFADESFDNAVMVDKISVSYTLKSEDITKQQKVECTPYVSHKEYFSENGKAEKTKTLLSVTPIEHGGLQFFVQTQSDELSEFGVYLPFNFMSKLNGGEWKRQFLFNSPYASKDNRYIYCYFSNPCGRNIIVVIQTPADGWKMDYSPYVGGHFFDNFKILANFDRAYKTGSSRKELRFSVFEVATFEEGLLRVSQTLHLPVAFYEQNVGAIGESVPIRILGDCDGVNVDGESFDLKNGDFSLKVKKSGDIRITPTYQGKLGLDCTVYGYLSLEELYKKSMDSVSEEDLRATDGNLCEHQCWASAMLRYMQKYGKNERYETMLKGLLDIVTETDEEKAKKYHDITIFSYPQKEFPAYHIYGSNRIQEQLFGITILLDAYQHFKEEKYLTYAVNALNTIIDFYQKENGGLMRYSKYYEKYFDYSTVCCLIIPIIDMANYFKDKNETLYQKYKTSSDQLAEHLFNRGYSFPTETEETDEAGEEMEDGSISCTALSLLYYCGNIERKQKYVDKALEILNVHEAWVTKTPIAQMYRSSLRWWETRWEGDKDGPALCMGHAWSIWRAEADYWAYVATKDEKWLKKAKGGFGCNLAKIHQDGESFAVYHADYIVGGGFMKGVKVRYEVVDKYPKQTDSGLSRYVWIRMADTLMRG